MRILFVSEEVAPFTQKSETAELVRTIPEQLQESGSYEMRIMMPRCGLISERRNRLHEVIRLSGSEISVGDQRETLKVKVASIPGIRLQVYFMDNSHYFKRKGIYADRDGKVFPDSPQRALFFARAVLDTIQKLGWAPDVVHAFGWMSSLVPMLLRTEYADTPVFGQVRTVYTPSRPAVRSPVADDFLGMLPREFGADVGFEDVGLQTADAVIFPPSLVDLAGDQPSFGDASEEHAAQATVLYDQVLNEVPV
jgi:starch synthase